MTCPVTASIPSCRNQQTPHPHPSPSAGAAVQEETRLAVQGMEGIVRGFIDNALAPSTRHTYRQGTLQYYKFCSIFHVSPPFPLTELFYAPLLHI